MVAESVNVQSAREARRDMLTPLVSFAVRLSSRYIIHSSPPGKYMIANLFLTPLVSLFSNPS